MLGRSSSCAVVVRRLAAATRDVTRTSSVSSAAAGLLLGVLFAIACGPVGRTSLELVVRDAASGALVPARIEVRDEDGAAHVANDALRVRGDCGGYLPDVIAELPPGSRGVANPNAGGVQFYTTGRAHLELEPGEYRIRVEKGPEYQRVERRVRIPSPESARLEIALARWIDLPAEGWYSADAHLHLARHAPQQDDAILHWMQAEDIHVANLLEVGNVDGLSAGRQYAHGPAGVHRDGNHLLVSGQESPRTHFLGHVILLGGRTPIHFADEYLQYHRFFQEAARQGARAGYAHLGELFGAPHGLAIDLPTQLLDFLEVQSADFAQYRIWYEALNAGFPLAAVAGSDYPCWPQLPGRARFYTRVEGPLDVASWLDGIEQGRTFVTNGPILDFALDGHGPGSRIRLSEGGEVKLAGRVRFDPARVQVDRLEVVRDGEVLRSVSVLPAGGEASFDFSERVAGTSWFALRSVGSRDDLAVAATGRPPAHAHTSPIYVEIQGDPGGAERSALAVRPWLGRLSELEARLDHPDSLAEWPSNGDGTRPELIRSNRAELLAAVARARGHYTRAAGKPEGSFPSYAADRKYMSPLAAVCVLLGVVILVTRAPLLFAPHATVRVYRRTIATNGRIRRIGLFSLMLGSLMVPAGYGEPGATAAVVLWLGVVMLLIGAGWLLPFPASYGRFAGLVLDAFEEPDGLRLIGALGVGFGVLFIYLGFAVV